MDESKTGFQNFLGSFVQGRPERCAKHRCANESGVARRESGKAAPRRWVALLCLWGRTIGPSGSRSLLGGRLATPRFAAEQEAQQSGCPSRGEVPISAAPWSPRSKNHREKKQRHQLC